MAQDFFFSKEVYIPFEKEETIYNSNRIVPVGLKDSTYYFVQKSQNIFFIKYLNLETRRVHLVFKDSLLKNEWPKSARFNQDGGIRVVLMNNGNDNNPRYIDFKNNTVIRNNLPSNFVCECLGKNNKSIFADYYWYDRLRLLRQKEGKKDTMIYYPISAASYGNINNFSFFDCNSKYIVYSDANKYNLKLMNTDIEVLDTNNYFKSDWIPFSKEKYLKLRKAGKSKFDAYFNMTFSNSHVEEIIFLDSNKFAFVEQRHHYGSTHYYIDLWKIENNKLVMVKENIEPPINYYYRLKDKDRLNDTANYNRLSNVFTLTQDKLIVTEWVSHKKPHIAYELKKKESKKRLNAFNSKMYGDIEIDHWFGIYNHNLMQYYETD
jgi:hypothetical protein